MNPAKFWGTGAIIVSAFAFTGCSAPTAAAPPAQRAADKAEAPLLQSKENHDFSQQIDQFLEKGDYDSALKKARQWQTDHPGDVDGHAALGHVLSIQGDLDGSIREGRAAIKINPRYDEIVKAWLDESLLIRKRYPKLQLFPMKAATALAATERKNWGARAAALLKAKNYDEIERVAANLLQSRALLPDDSWQLDAFANGLCLTPEAEAVWQANNARLHEWHRARPNSTLARLMLGRSWSDGAGNARGEDSANQVSPAQWARMNKRLSQAAPLLSASMKEIARTPLVFSGLHSWALLGQVPRPIYEKAWKQANAVFPDTTKFYINKAQFLMPRWYGAPGEWETFAKNSADKMGGARGDKLYARIVLDQSFYYGEDFLNTNSVSWPRAKRGINAMLAENKDNVSVATQALRLANVSEDIEFQRQLFRGPLAHAFTPDDISAKDLYQQRIYAFTH